MTKKKRPNYSPEFRLETAQLVVDNGYTHEDKNLGRKRPSFKTSPADLNVFLSDLVQ